MVLVEELSATIYLDATPFIAGIKNAIASIRKYEFALYARAGRPYGKSIRGFKKWRKQVCII